MYCHFSYVLDIQNRQNYVDCHCQWENKIVRRSMSSYIFNISYNLAILILRSSIFYSSHNCHRPPDCKVTNYVISKILTSRQSEFARVPHAYARLNTGTLGTRLPRPRRFDVLRQCVTHADSFDMHMCIGKRVTETVSKTGAHRENWSASYYFQIARPETILFLSQMSHFIM